MIRANQSVLNQKTNIALLNIRQSEITYYTSITSAFGTQAALIGGFTYGVWLKDHTTSANHFVNTLQDVYWVTAAGTMVCAIHIIMTTMFIQVFGPGLGLNGPVGSMVKATEGMRIELQPVMISFMLMLILFSISTIMLFWIIMDYFPAAGATIVFLIGARYWYIYCERIYLRFYWKPEGNRWQEESLADIEAPHLPNDEDNPNNNIPAESLSKHATTTSQRPSGVERPSLDHFSLFHSRHNHDDDRHSQSHTPEEGNSSKKPGSGNPLEAYHMNSSATRKPHDVVMEGYLLKKGSYDEIDFSKEPWERRYFVLFHNAELFIYKTRQDFRSNPTHPIYNRPLYLKDFLISFCDTDKDGNFLHVFDSHSSQMLSSISSHYSSSPKEIHYFQITLKPQANEEMHDKKHLMKNWLLRCDTEEELHLWQSEIKELVPTNLRD
jgi:hypothetical protein